MSAFSIRPIVLASASPRRKELLHRIGIPFSVMPADVDERIRNGEHPEDYAVRVAHDKAAAVNSLVQSGIIIAADTIVVLEGQTLGKPTDAQDAMRMLSMLSGRPHRVVTGLVVIDAETGMVERGCSETVVVFRELGVEEIEKYVATGEPLDKAGAYGIQERGGVFVKSIEGCFCNVVGLPIALLHTLLRRHAIELF